MATSPWSGLAAWVLASFACVVAVRLILRRRGNEDRIPPAERSTPWGLIVAVPLVSGFVVALAVSLGVRLHDAPTMVLDGPRGIGRRSATCRRQHGGGGRDRH